MSDIESITARKQPNSNFRRSLGDATLGLLIGGSGGLMQRSVLQSSRFDSVLIGAAFGLVFGLFFARRATTAGAGLIWGISAAVLLWFVTPMDGASAYLGDPDLGRMFDDIRQRFPELAACLVLVGMPTGIGLGIRGGLNHDRVETPFHWYRAIVAGGMAGVVSGLIFGYWMLVGGFFPLVAGWEGVSSQSAQVTAQFCISLTIGITFGLLFQRDVRGYGSCMGWGLGYAVLWWFVGPLTVFPVVSGAPPNWSIDSAGRLFGALVGYILYGLILGVVYATLDRVWVRLFIQSDPLNREREGVGIRLVRSLQWGGISGLAGGLLSSPLMLATGVLPHVIGLGIHLSTRSGLLAHLLISTIIGMSFGVLFRDESSTVIMSGGWGWVFGLIWWYAGPLTLLPLLLTGEIDWRISAASALLPSLIAHLIYGATTGAVFYLLERRYRSRHVLGPRVATRELRHLRPEGTPAPALWFLALSLGIAIPILLG